MTPAEQFVTELTHALHESGAPVHRLEDTVALVSEALGLHTQIFATPTSLFLSFDPPGAGDPRVRLLRVVPRGVNLARLVTIDEIGIAVAARRIGPEEGMRRLHAVRLRPERWPGLPTVLAWGGSAATAAVFFGGGPNAVYAAGGLGLLLGLLSRLARRWAAFGRLFEPVGAFMVAAGATLLAREVPLSVPVVTLAGIVVLLPGLTLTVAIAELAAQHLSAGTARIAGAAVTFLQLGVGTALGWKLAALLPRALRATAAPLPSWAPWAALVPAALCFAVLFQSRRRDLPFIVGIALLAFAASRQGQAWLGPELGACVGGLVVGLAGNLHARIRRLPAAVVQLPGLLVLVPGSLGFRGLGALMQDDVAGGVDAAFGMFVVAASLVAGLLTAGVLLPPRKTL